jgi:hypothetical protein
MSHSYWLAEASVVKWNWLIGWPTETGIVETVTIGRIR